MPLAKQEVLAASYEVDRIGMVAAGLALDETVKIDQVNEQAPKRTSLTYAEVVAKLPLHSPDQLQLY